MGPQVSADDRELLCQRQNFEFVGDQICHYHLVHGIGAKILHHLKVFHFHKGWRVPAYKFPSFVNYFFFLVIFFLYRPEDENGKEEIYHGRILSVSWTILSLYIEG